MAWLVYLHGGKLVLLLKVTVDVDNIKLDNDVMMINSKFHNRRLTKAHSKT